MPNYMTIPGFEDMTAQQVFDMSAAHLLRQMVRSEKPGACLYRSGELACAAGVFLTDAGAEIADSMGGSDGSPWDRVVAAKIAPSTNESLIGSLQAIHDFREPDEWRRALRLLAKEYNLNHAVLR